MAEGPADCAWRIGAAADFAKQWYCRANLPPNGQVICQSTAELQAFNLECSAILGYSITTGTVQHAVEVGPASVQGEPIPGQGGGGGGADGGVVTFGSMDGVNGAEPACKPRCNRSGGARLAPAPWLWRVLWAAASALLLLPRSVAGS